MKEVVRPRVYMGVLLFVLVIVATLTIAFPLQLAWGMWGLALTELILLVLAIIPTLILKWDFREVFRVRIPSLRQFYGTLVLWIGSYIAAFSTTIIISYFFPEGTSEVSLEIQEMITSVSFPVRLLIMAVLPAICEEALHRGFILYTFKYTRKWTAIISMGFIFGLFHLSPHRFLATAILGAAMTYIMLETRNILLPMLFHFVNNSLSAFATLFFTSSAEVVEGAAIPLAFVGMFLLPAMVVPFLFIAGSRLLLDKEQRKSRPISKAIWIVAITMAVLLAITGAVITVVGFVELVEDYMAISVFKTSL